MYSVTVETERSSALCTALLWKPSGALLCVQRYRGDRAELCFVYSVTVETEQALLCVQVTVELLGTELLWKPSRALLCVQRICGNRARALLLCTALLWKPSRARFVLQRYCETERSSALCTVLPWRTEAELCFCVPEFTVESEQALLFVKHYRGNLALFRLQQRLPLAEN